MKKYFFGIIFIAWGFFGAEEAKADTGFGYLKCTLEGDGVRILVHSTPKIFEYDHTDFVILGEIINSERRTEAFEEQIKVAWSSQFASQIQIVLGLSCSEENIYADGPYGTATKTRNNGMKPGTSLFETATDMEGIETNIREIFLSE